MVETSKPERTRFYIDGDRRVPGVTSIIDKKDKPFLPPWYARMTAELAIDSLNHIQAMAGRDRAGAVQYLSGAARRYTKIRADVGSAAHDLFERMMRGEPLGPVGPDLEPYRANFAEFLAAVNPELLYAEDVAWSDAHDYAGRLDSILRVWFDPETGEFTPDRSGRPFDAIVDWKTSKSAHPEVALQLSGYRHADWLIHADGTREPMPAVDGGYVLHITDQAWSFIPVPCDRRIFMYFLALRSVFEWDAEVAPTVLAAGPSASGGQLITGTQRRR